ncbi:hypothetical protein ACFLTJ_02660 [Chloroflexota bacterium]
MAKGAIITDDVRATIASVFIKHPEFRAKEIQEEVNRQLRQITPNISPDWPGLSTIQKEVARLRKKKVARSPELKELDMSWSVISMAKYPISPEALPSVLQVWVWTRENRDRVFTIREAQWAARLYKTIKPIEQLAKLSRTYALLENIFQLTEKGSGSHSTDLEIFRVTTGQEITPERERKIMGLSMTEWREFDKRLKILR